MGIATQIAAGMWGGIGRSCHQLQSRPGAVADADPGPNLSRSPGSTAAHRKNSLAASLLHWWKSAATRHSRLSRLALLDRIPLGPRQTLFLVEAEGLHLLVATSADGTPAIFPLPAAHGRAESEKVHGISQQRQSRVSGSRVSW